MTEKPQVTETPDSSHLGSQDPDVVIDEAGKSIFGESLFEEEAMPTDAELKGEGPPKPDEKPEVDVKPKDDPEKKEVKPEEGKEKSPEDKKAAPQPKGDEKPEAKAKPEEGPTKPEEPKKPPKGYVPQEALTEARFEIRELKGQLAEVRDLVSSLRESKEHKDEEIDEPEFKILSDNEFNDLVEEDPTEAIKYQAKLIAHKDKMAQIHRERADEEAKDAQMDAGIQIAIRKIEELVPGVYDQDQSVNQELTKFATENGFDKDFLAVMTNPATRIIPVNSNSEYILGKGAVCLVDMLNRLKGNGSGDLVSREELEKEYSQKFEGKLETAKAEIIKNISEKLKLNPDQVFKSITDIAPSAPEKVHDSTEMPVIQTEEDFAKLSDREKVIALGLSV